MWPAYGICGKLIGDAICICEGGWCIPSVESLQLLPIGYTSAHRTIARPGSLNRGAMQSRRLALRAKPYGKMILYFSMSRLGSALLWIYMQVFDRFCSSLQGIGIDGCFTYRSFQPYSTPGGWCTTHWVYCAYPGFGAISRVQRAVWVAQWWKLEHQVSQVTWGSWSWYLVVVINSSVPHIISTSSPHHSKPCACRKGGAMWSPMIHRCSGF